MDICSIFILVAPEESHSSSMGDLDEFLEDESTVSSIATKNYDIRPVSDPGPIWLAIRYSAIWLAIRYSAIWLVEWSKTKKRCCISSIEQEYSFGLQFHNPLQFETDLRDELLILNIRNISKENFSKQILSKFFLPEILEKIFWFLFLIYGNLIQQNFMSTYPFFWYSPISGKLIHFQSVSYGWVFQKSV